jgi:ribonuclease R
MDPFDGRHFTTEQASAYREQIVELLAIAPEDGMPVAEITSALGLPEERRRWVRLVLRGLADDGQVERRGRKYRLCQELGGGARVEGVLQVHPSGRGFVDHGEAFEDIVVPRGQLADAIDGDTVEVELNPERPGRRQTGIVVRVVSRGRRRLTGVYRSSRGDRRPVIEADDPRIRSRVEVVDGGEGVRDGEAVLAAITGYPEAASDPILVQVTRALGEPGLLLTEVAKCVEGEGLEEAFPDEALAAAGAIPGEIPAEDLTAGRLDLRHLHFVTIDPLTARDFDDAVAVEPGPRGSLRLWVAVADVTHYVPERSILDDVARDRGCSVYLPDRAIPMLPPALSSSICSLVPGRDRLAMVVWLDLTREGKAVDEGCAAAVVHSHGRLDYGGVAAALKGEFEGRRESYREHADLLETLQRVASTLRRRRLERGSLDLDLPEAEVQLDEDDPNRVRDIVQGRPDTPIKRAYGLIEELMVAANEAVARLLSRAGVPTIWRIHAPPRPEALDTLREWMAAYGLLLPRGGTDPRTLAKLLKQVAKHRAARPLSYLVLRTLKQATYGVVNLGHFGLASPAYLHFTSPIRRYPDLHVHRLVKRMLHEAGQPAGRHEPHVQASSEEALAKIATLSTARERRAIDVEREVQRVYASSLMRDRIGDEAWGTLSGVNSFGVFVALDSPFIEGLVKIENLPGYLDFDPWQLRLVERHTGATYSLGDRLRVRVVDTCVSRRQIDLEPIPGRGNHEPDPDYVRQGKSTGRSKRSRRSRGDRRQGRGDRGRRRKQTGRRR